MSAQKTVSQLSFAAIALFIAAIPCFAQTEKAMTEQMSASTQVAVNSVRRTYRTEPTDVAASEAKQKQLAFSPTAFMQAVNESTSFETKSSSSTPTLVLNDFDQTRLVLEKPASSKRITFVPSKGQRIPQ
ncbi:MAG TPA: hypothetical protein VF251_07465 [Pyrinomonadaceae bacterium]